MANIGFISLGCAKNQVDCERMMYRVQEAGFTVQADVIGADVVVIKSAHLVSDRNLSLTSSSPERLP